MDGANMTGFLAGAGAAAAFSIAYARLRPLKKATRAKAFIVLAVLAIPSPLFAAYYLGLPLEYAWYYEMRAWTGSEFLILPAGAAAGALATFLPRLLLALPLFALLAMAIIPYLKPVIMPLQDGDFAEEWKDGYCLQSTASTCGPASASTIAKSLGINLTEKETARAAHTYQNGTEAWYLARYLRRQGAKVHFDFRDTFSPDVKFPAVVGVKLGRTGHFIPVLEMKGDQIHIADPLHGGEWISMESFRARYGFTGFHMTVSHNRGQ
jgi:hypothetical protein